LHCSRAERMSWTVEEVGEYEDTEKRGGVDMVCDEEIVVVGLSGWSGEARVYDIQSGNLRFKLQCNDLGETPAPFSHDNIMVWLGNSVIVTMGLNKNTLMIWDKSTGAMLAQDLHKDKEKADEMSWIKESIKGMEPPEADKWVKENLIEKLGWSQEKVDYIGMAMVFGIIPNQRELTGLTVKDDVIYGGYDGGMLIIANQDGEWKKVKEVKLDFKPSEIELAGDCIAVVKVEEGKKKMKLWDPEKEEMGEMLSVEMKAFYNCRFVYPHILMVGGRGSCDNTGVEIWNVETNEFVRHLLKGEKKYEFISTNGKFFAVCEFVNSFCSGDDKSLKVAVYNVEQVLDPGVPEESLWSHCLEYKLADLDHVRAVLNSTHLIVNHSATKLSVSTLG